jgi:predicted DsbA family dithiol-disulfide isomerase
MEHPTPATGEATEVPGAAAELATTMAATSAVIVVFSDLLCPWAHVATTRLGDRRRALGVEDEVRIDHRAYPLELVNGRPTPKPHLEQEIAAARELEPEAGWSTSTDGSTWQASDHEYAVSSLLALEAVQAAKGQGPGISEALDLALRRAFFRDSRCISVLPVVADVAATVPGLDVDALVAELWSGRPRRDVRSDLDSAAGDAVTMSPHVFIPGGGDWPNPGIDLDTSGDAVRVIADRTEVYDEILELALADRSFEAG